MQLLGYEGSSIGDSDPYRPVCLRTQSVLAAQMSVHVPSLDVRNPGLAVTVLSLNRTRPVVSLVQGAGDSLLHPVNRSAKHVAMQGPL